MSYDFLFKFIVVGEANVGKTAMCERLTRNYFSPEAVTTVGVEFSSLIVETAESAHVKCQLWDTAGCERFRAITKNYYRGVTGVILMFDVSRRVTFNELSKWKREITENTDNAPFVILIGSKTDKVRLVSEDEGKEFAERNNYLYDEISSKDNKNVRDSFRKLIDTIMADEDRLENLRIKIKDTNIEREDRGWDFKDYCCTVQ